MKFKHAIRTFIFFILFFILQFFLGLLLKADYNSYARIMMKELHSDINIDVLFLGDSHIYRAINPIEYKKATNLDCFIAAFPGEEIDATYAILQEALIYHPEIKYVYIDVDVEQLWNEDFKKRTNLKHVYACSNYLKNRKIRRTFLLNATSPYYFLNSSLKIGKNKINAKPKNVIETLKSYLNKNYFTGYFPNIKDETFHGRGFVTRDKEVIELFSKPSEIVIFTPEIVSKDYLKTFDKINDLLKDKSLNFTLLSVPESPYKFFKYENYLDIHRFIENLAEKYNCQYLDFNYLKKDYLNLTSNDFYDIEHVNSIGSKKITDAFNLIVTSDSPLNYFYTDYQNNIYNDQNKIYGIEIIDSKDNRSFKIAPIGSYTNDSTIKYRVYFEDIKYSSKKFDLLTQDTFVQYPEHSSGTMRIECFLNEENQGYITKKFNTKWIK